MSKNGQIKREDIISNEALNWADDYAKNIKKVIKANKKVQKSIIKTHITMLKYKLKRI
jgi:hypothetical protein